MDRMEPKLPNNSESSPTPRVSLAFTTLANQEKSLELLLATGSTYRRM
jgi:hypothetical protein